MKIAFIPVALALLGSGIVSCKKDNYAAPATMLTGKIVYKGEALNFQRTLDRTNYRVRFELRESGWGKTGPITIPISQEGTFSATLFNGEYKLVFPADNIPFIMNESTPLSRDTIALSLHGNKAMDIEVVPYYMIRDAAFAMSKVDSIVSGNFKLEQIITGANAKNAERVFLYISRTPFVDDADKVAVSELDASSITDLNNINLSVKVPASLNNNYGTQMADQKAVYARIGLKIADKDHLLFSQITKLDL